MNAWPTTTDLHVTLPERAELVLRHARSSAVGMVILAALFVIFFGGAMPAPLCAAWVVAYLSVAAYRILVSRSYLATPEAQRSPAKAAVRTALSASISGGLLAGVVLAMIAYGDLQLTTIAVVYVAAITSATVSALAPLPVAFGTFATMPMLAVGYGIASLGPPGHWGYPIAGVLYPIIQAAYAANVFRAAVESARLRHENLELIARIEAERDRAEQAHEAKTRFLAAASHDLRQPLNALAMYCAVLEDRVDHSDEDGLVGRIRASVDDLRSLLDATLDVSRFDAGAVATHIRDVRLMDLFETREALFRTGFPDIALEVQSGPSGLTARTDAALLARVLDNLLSNAAMHGGRSVTLEARAEAEEVLVVVRDDGPGIPEEQAARIFEPFIQLGNPERDRRKGVGLGLAIVGRTLELLGHAIDLSSSNEGGAQFTVRVPRGADRPAKAEPPIESHAASDGLIWFVDDEPDARDGMSALLARWGYRVVVFEGERECRDRAESEGAEAPDLLLVDYRLRGGVTGADVLSWARGRFGETLPGIVLTGDTENPAVKQLSANGLPVLMKPVRPPQLRSLLARLVGVRRAPRGLPASPPPSRPGDGSPSVRPAPARRAPQP